MPSACFRKSDWSVANCSEVIDWLPAHHMFLSVVASRTVNLSFGLRPVNTPVSAHSAPSDDSTASPVRSECSVSCGAPKFQFTPLRFFKPNLSAPKAPLCTPVSCTKILLEPANGQTCRCRGKPEYSLPASVRRPNSDERRACQADPASFGLFRSQPRYAAEILAAVRSVRICRAARHSVTPAQ